MIYSVGVLLEKYNQYTDVYGKIGRLVKEGKLIKLSKGLYVDDPSISGLYVANAIYGPSYISFNSALSYWGLIPESVYTITSATTQKLKKKEYDNKLGHFTYRDIPVDAFPYGIKLIHENGYTFRIATKEKALCDQLYQLPPIKNQKELKAILFSDMRLDNDLFGELKIEDIHFISQRYHSRNLKLFSQYLRRMKNE